MSTLLQFPRQDVYYDTATNNILRWGPFTVDGVEIAAAATAKIAISNPAGTAIVTTTDMTADLPYFTYVIDTDDTDDYALDEGYIADVVVTYSATEYKYRFLFDVVRQPFPCLVGDTDLEGYFPTLDARRPSAQSDYSPQILLAFEEVKTEILAKGFRPALMFDPAQFRLPIVFLTLHNCCRGIWLKIEGDRWETSSMYYWDRYQAALGTALETVSVRYDENENGQLDDGEKETYSPILLKL